MFKKLLACCVAVVAFAAVAGPASASASEVVLEAGGKSLKEGAELHGLSLNPVVTSEAGQFLCASGEIKGQVSKNPPAAFKVSETLFVGEAAGKEEKGFCPSGGAKGFVEVGLSFTSPLSFSVGEKGPVGSASAVILFGGCEFNATLSATTFKGSQDLRLDGTGETAFCTLGNKVLFESDFYFSSGGNAVTFNVI